MSTELTSISAGLHSSGSIDVGLHSGCPCLLELGCCFPCTCRHICVCTKCTKFYFNYLFCGTRMLKIVKIMQKAQMLRLSEYLRFSGKMRNLDW